MTALEALTHARRELQSRISNREPIQVERHADPLDDVYQYIQRELTAGELSRETELLRRVEAAIERCERGFYGICIDCGQRIKRARLKALPWAERCRECEQQMEAEG
ncbi:MAG: TraR/DksA family transcriptional regulator [Bryobacteraceae bacterium]